MLRSRLAEGELARYRSVSEALLALDDRSLGRLRLRGGLLATDARRLVPFAFNMAPKAADSPAVRPGAPAVKECQDLAVTAIAAGRSCIERRDLSGLFSPNGPAGVCDSIGPCPLPRLPKLPKQPAHQPIDDVLL